MNRLPRPRHHAAAMSVATLAAAAGCSTAAGELPDGPIEAGGADAGITPDGSPLGEADASPAVDAATGAVLRVFGDDYGDAVAYAPFGGSTGGPSIVGVSPHGGSTALQLDVPAAGYTGGAFRAASAVDLTGFTAVTFWARASRAATLNVVGIGNDAATTTYWAEATALPVSPAWARYVVPLPDPSRLVAEHGLFHVAEGSDEGAYTLWLDDIQYEALEPAALGAPSPAIATETVELAIGAAHLINGTAVTYPLDGAPRTIAASRRYFTFASSQPGVAVVDVEGRVTAKATGTAVITARLGAPDAPGAPDAIGVTTIHVHP